MLDSHLSDYLEMLKMHSPKLSEGVLALSLREQGWDDETIQESVQYFKSGVVSSHLHTTKASPNITILPPPKPSMTVVIDSETSRDLHAVSLTPSLPPELTQPQKVQPFPTLPPELLSKPSIVSEIIVPALKNEPLIEVRSMGNEYMTEGNSVPHRGITSHEPLPVGQAASDAVGIVRSPKVTVMPQSPVKKIVYINPEADQDEREHPSTLVKEGYRFTASWVTYLYLTPLALTLPVVMYVGIQETLSAVVLQGAKSYGSLFALFSVGAPQTGVAFDMFTFFPSVLFTVFLVLGVLLFTRRAFSASGNVLVSFLSGNALYIFVSLASIVGIQQGIPLVLKAISGSTYTLSGSLIQLPLIVSYQVFIGFILLQIVLLYSYRGAHVVQKSPFFTVVQAIFGILGLLVALYVCGTGVALALYVQKTELCVLARTNLMRDNCIAQIQRE